MICKICGREISVSGLSGHLRGHKITLEKYILDNFKNTIIENKKLFLSCDIGIVYYNYQEETYEILGQDVVFFNELTNEYNPVLLTNPSRVCSAIAKSRNYSLLDDIEVPNIKEMSALYKYFVKFNYTCNNPELLKRRCELCDTQSYLSIDTSSIDFKNKTYSLLLKNKFCLSDDCKLKLIKLVWGEDCTDITRFEYIGSTTKYLAMIKDETLEEIKYKKSKGYREYTFYSNLQGFIEKFGEVEGTIKYNSRIEKIKDNHGTKISTWINKYGEIDGKILFHEYLDKLSNAISSSKIGFSKSEKQCLNLISTYFDIEIKEQQRFLLPNNKIAFVDGICYNKNLIFEFFGDYWHANPSVYLPTQINKTLNVQSRDIWETDAKRLERILEISNALIIVIWEKDFNTNKIKMLENINSIILSNTTGIHYA